MPCRQIFHSHRLVHHCKPCIALVPIRWSLVVQEAIRHGSGSGKAIAVNSNSGLLLRHCSLQHYISLRDVPSYVAGTECDSHNDSNRLRINRSSIAICCAERIRCSALSARWLSTSSVVVTTARIAMIVSYSQLLSRYQAKFALRALVFGELRCSELKSSFVNVRRC